MLPSNGWFIRIWTTRNLSLWLYEYFLIICIIVWAPSDIRNMQYEMRICQKVIIKSQRQDLYGSDVIFLYSQIHYDDTFNSDTSDVDGYINSMLTHMQSYFCQISLGTQIQVEVSIVKSWKPTFSCMFLNPNNFFDLNSNCSNLLYLRNLQEQVKKHSVSKNFSGLLLF